jgi:serine/threonine-protein kinase
MQRVRPRRTAVLIAGGLLLVGAVGGAILFALPTRQPAPAIAVAQPPAPPPPPVVEPDAGAPEDAHFFITSTPPGAAVRIDGRPAGVTPLELDAAPSVVHYVSFEKAGFHRLELETPPAEPGARADVPAKLVAIQTVTRQQPPPPAANSNEPGFLSLDTLPWTKVNIDGDPAGSTPLFKKRLAPGKHTLTFVNEGASINTTRVVTIEPEKTLKLSLKLP